MASRTSSRGVSSIQLLDTGNLILANSTYANASSNIVWKNFEHPSNTLISCQKLGLDATLYAAASDDDYATGGAYSMALSLFLSDLNLYASFNKTPGPQQYWSLQAAFCMPANAWVCCWASYVQVGNGLTIYDNQSQAGMSTSSSNFNPNVDLFEYARLEPDGNLRT
ncbi:hypothetical protein L7F22_051201 [Adiantum nelumboides]|nr:hypothetical protein [Adiantum nelumboides]